ncbi:hypothetical protein, partial [Thomasclavelia sp.]
NYALEVICDFGVILLPLSCIGKILSKDDKELLVKDSDNVIYGNREYQTYILSKILKRENANQNQYAILIQNEDIEAILYVENIGRLIELQQVHYKLPAYLKKFNLSYIISCHMIENGKIAFQIDFIKLLKRFYK